MHKNLMSEKEPIFPIQITERVFIKYLTESALSPTETATWSEYLLCFCWDTGIWMSPRLALRSDQWHFRFFIVKKKYIENYFKQNSSLRKVWDATTQKYLVRKLLKIFGYIKETTVHLPQNYFSHSGGDILLCFIPHTLSLPFIRYVPSCHLRKIIHQLP